MNKMNKKINKINKIIQIKFQYNFFSPFQSVSVQAQAIFKRYIKKIINFILIVILIITALFKALFSLILNINIYRLLLIFKYTIIYLILIYIFLSYNLLTLEGLAEESVSLLSLFKINKYRSSNININTNDKLVMSNENMQIIAESLLEKNKNIKSNNSNFSDEELKDLASAVLNRHKKNNLLDNSISPLERLNDNLNSKPLPTIPSLNIPDSSVSSISSISKQTDIADNPIINTVNNIIDFDPDNPFHIAEYLRQFNLRDSSYAADYHDKAINQMLRDWVNKFNPFLLVLSSRGKNQKYLNLASISFLIFVIIFNILVIIFLLLFFILVIFKLFIAYVPIPTNCEWVLISKIFPILPFQKKIWKSQINPFFNLSKYFFSIYPMAKIKIFIFYIYSKYLKIYKMYKITKILLEKLILKIIKIYVTKIIILIIISIISMYLNKYNILQYFVNNNISLWTNEFLLATKENFNYEQLYILFLIIIPYIKFIITFLIENLTGLINYLQKIENVLNTNNSLNNIDTNTTLNKTELIETISAADITDESVVKTENKDIINNKTNFNKIFWVTTLGITIIILFIYTMNSFKPEINPDLINSVGKNNPFKNEFSNSSIYSPTVLPPSDPNAEIFSDLMEFTIASQRKLVEQDKRINKLIELISNIISK